MPLAAGSGDDEWLRAFDRLAAGSVFSRDDIHGRVALKPHGFSFDAIRINTHTALLIRYAGHAKEPVTDGIPPDDGVSRLIFKSCQNVRVTLLIYAAAERFPLTDVLRGAFRTFVMGVVNVLDHGFAGLQHARVRNMVEEKEQLVRSGFRRLIQLGYRRRILPDIARAGGHGAIHPHPLMVSAVPLAPTVVLGRFHSGAVVTSENVRQCLGPQRTRVALIDLPRIDLHVGNGA